MNETTRALLEVAYKAMQKAYYFESDGVTNVDKDSAKKVGEVLQRIGDIIRGD